MPIVLNQIKKTLIKLNILFIKRNSSVFLNLNL